MADINAAADGLGPSPAKRLNQNLSPPESPVRPPAIDTSPPSASRSSRGSTSSSAISRGSYTSQVAATVLGSVRRRSARVAANEERDRVIQEQKRKAEAIAKTREEVATSLGAILKAERTIEGDNIESLLERFLISDREKDEYKQQLSYLNKRYTSILNLFTESRPLIDVLTLQKLTDLAVLQFSPERVALWNIKKGTTRSIWEHVTADEQCQSSIGENIDPNCWICGFNLEEFELPLLKGQPQKRKECEHVLPICQSVLVLSLYTYENTKKDDQTLYDLEYRWAHKHCNRVKNDDVYFQKGEDGLIHPDAKAWKSLLTSIQQPRSDTGEFYSWLKEKIRGNPNWISERIANFNTVYGAITEKINRTSSDVGVSMYYLCMVAWSEEIARRMEDEDSRVILGFHPEIAMADDSDIRYEGSAPRSPGQDTSFSERLASMGGRKRRTYRNKRPKRRYQSIKISSKRHSLS